MSYEFKSTSYEFKSTSYKLMWDNVTEFKCNIFGREWLLNTENKQMQTYNIKWNYFSH